MNLLLRKYYANEKRKIILLLPTYTVIAELKFKTYQDLFKILRNQEFHWNEIKSWNWYYYLV